MDSFLLQFCSYQILIQLVPHVTEFQKSSPALSLLHEHTLIDLYHFKMGYTELNKAQYNQLDREIPSISSIPDFL